MPRRRRQRWSDYNGGNVKSSRVRTSSSQSQALWTFIVIIALALTSLIEHQAQKREPASTKFYAKERAANMSARHVRHTEAFQFKHDGLEIERVPASAVIEEESVN